MAVLLGGAMILHYEAIPKDRSLPLPAACGGRERKRKWVFVEGLVVQNRPLRRDKHDGAMRGIVRNG